MKKILYFLLPILSLSTVSGKRPDDPQVARLEKWIETRTEGLAPGVAVGIVRDGKVIYEKYAGHAHLEHRVKVGPLSRFNIASNAKQFTALTVLKLKREGRLDLDDDIRKYLPELFPRQDRVVTIANLLDQSSGIRDVYDLWALQGKTWWENFLDNGDALELLTAQRELNFAPGSRSMYSNSNYLLLAEIVRRVTGRRFSEYAVSLFERLGMNHTSFATNFMAVLPDRARPYGDWDGWKEYPTITNLHGDGALYTTMADQLVWERIVQTRSANGLDAELIEASQGLVPGSRVEEYGFGLSFGTYKGLAYSYHEGNTGAYNATFLRFPSERLAVVAMSNNGSISTYALARRYAEAVLGRAQWTDTVHPSRPDTVGSKPKVEEVVGAYQADGDTLIRITTRRRVLFCDILEEQPLVRLYHEEGDIYRYKTDRDRKIVFSVDEQGERIVTLYHPSEEPRVGARLSAEPIGEGYATSISGRYWNDETGTEILVRHREGADYEIIRNGRKRAGALVVKDLLRERSYALRVTRDDEGRVVGLRVDHGRIRNVYFERASG